MRQLLAAAAAAAAATAAAAAAALLLVVVRDHLAAEQNGLLGIGRLHFSRIFSTSV